uniref:Ubiquilin 1 n=1 Tax=Pseudonaja textilis TaxID=8673 RepID=A0A670Z4G0_PSETE
VAELQEDKGPGGVAHQLAAMSESKRAPGATAGHRSRVVRVTVKTLKRKEQFEVADSTHVQEFKKLIADRFKTPPEQLSLIFAGEILNDQDTLVQRKIGDGSKVHLFIKSQRNQPEDLMASCHEIVAQTMENLLLQMVTLNLDASALNSNPLLLGFLIGVTGMNVLDLNAQDVSDFVGEAQEQDATRQELIIEVMQHPFMQNLFGDTEQVRQMIMSVPQMQQLAEQNPEIHHILNNSEFLREMIDVATSPAVMDEIIRNHDRALSNLESTPGGYSALQQLYNDIEVPMLNAVQAQFQGSSFPLSEAKPSPGGVSPLSRTENREPLPNPWTPQPNSSGGDNICNGDLSNAGNGTEQGYVLLALGPGVRPGPSKTESIQNMVHQLTDNLEFMQNISNALTKPNGPTQMFLSHCHGAPPPQEWPQQLPSKLAKSASALLLTNPRAVQALLQLQMSLLILTREVPDFLQALTDPDVDLESMEDSEEGESPSSGAESFLSIEESLELGSNASKADDEEEEEEEEDMEEQAPEALYQGQLEQLRAMGFPNQDLNLRALMDTEGDISLAIEKLTNSRAS